MGFSDALWMLLSRMWLEEYNSTDSTSARPNTTGILEQLQDEAEKWSPISRLLEPPAPIERQVSGMSSAFQEGAHVWLT